MKIILCNTLYPPLGIGGSERSVQFLAEALVRRGHEVTVLSQGTRWWDETERKNGVKVIRTGSPPGYGPNIYAHRTRIQELAQVAFQRFKPDRNAKLAEYVEAEKPDIVNTSVIGQPHGLWRALKRRNVPVVHTIRNHSLICNNRMFRGGRNCTTQCHDCRVRFQGRKAGTSALDGVIGISRYILQQHLIFGYFAEVPLRTVIPNSYLGDFEPADIAREDADGPLRLGYLGRLHPTKGIEPLLRAVGRFPSDQVKLYVAGTGNPHYVRQMEALAPTATEFLGFTTAGNLLSRIDVLVVPSLWNEPFGRTYIEAMAHGVPVLGSITGAGNELVHEGETGWLCDPSDPDQVEKKIRAILSARKQLPTLRRNCIARSNEFLPDRVAHLYESFYKRVLEARPPRRSDGSK